MLSSARSRRQLGVAAWVGLALMTAAWLWQARGSVDAWAWPATLLPFVLLLPGLLRPSRNIWLLGLLATIGYATLGFMDVIANPSARVLAPALAAASLAAFFLMIPATRTLPAPPRNDEL